MSAEKNDATLALTLMYQLSFTNLLPHALPSPAELDRIVVITTENLHTVAHMCF